MNPETTNPKDYSVVSFHNSTSFRFTPDMGCMYNGRAINDTTGQPGIGSGVTMTLPYHIGEQLALNLAKAVLLQGAPVKDPADKPHGIALWSDTGLESIKNSFMKELYSEEKPVDKSQADILIEKIAELNALKEKIEERLGEDKKESDPKEESSFKSKADVVAELTKRDIKFDARKTKAELEKLLA